MVEEREAASEVIRPSSPLHSATSIREAENEDALHLLWTYTNRLETVFGYFDLLTGVYLIAKVPGEAPCFTATR